MRVARMAKPLYSIDRWDELYECAQSRKLKGDLRWITVPTSHDGKGYKRVMRLPNGPAIYAAWMLILQVAAKCSRRGVLADSKGPLDAEDLSIKTDCPQELFEQALVALSDERIGWLVVGEWDGSGTVPTIKGKGREYLPTDQTRPDQTCKGRELDAGASPPPSESEFVEVWNSTGVLPAVREFTPKRRTAFRNRILNRNWCKSWRDGITRIAASGFCRGENDRGWKAGVDWFLKPDTLTKILEGAYDNQARAGPYRIPTERLTVAQLAGLEPE